MGVSFNGRTPISKIGYLRSNRSTPVLTNQDLIQNLISEKTLVTPRIIEAFKAIDRKDFVSPELQSRGYEDVPLSIGYGATISQPTTVAFMLEKLQPQPADKILEIGTGSGYLTGLLAQIVGGGGSIFSVEYIPELKELAEHNLRKYNFRNISLFTGDGKIGLKKFSPFDRIISSASGDEIPKDWKNQLKIGGRIVAPVGDDIIVLDRISKRKFKEERHPGFIFVTLR